MDVMDKTGYCIDRDKFFGINPDENMTLKRDAQMFYSGSGEKPHNIPKVNLVATGFLTIILFKTSLK